MAIQDVGVGVHFHSWMNIPLRISMMPISSHL